MLRIYNSYTKQKEIFKSIIPNHVGLYVCGPTVSGESHLGHARPFITFDVVQRWLKHLGYKVRYVRNITDAGHFEDGYIATDKVAEKAKLEKLEPMELVHKYTTLFHKGMELFNCENPNIEPTATGHIPEQILMIEDIIKKGFAYESNGSVYFDMIKYAKYHPFGHLSGRVLEEQYEGTRDLEGQNEKRNRADFALWKNAPPEHIMRWKSPWGEGFPGWHIECSAMSSKYLGTIFDIHGGGMDLQFPHHECEIAQSTIAHGNAPVKYWMHNNMITINGKKMGKSYNNVIKLTELFSGKHPLLYQPYHPMVIRFNILQTHYRSTMDFSNEALMAAEVALRRLWESYEVLQKLPSDNLQIYSDILKHYELDVRVQELCFECEKFMNDDFSTALVLANLFELSRVINNIKAGNAKLINSTIIFLKNTFKLYMEDILGLQSLGASKSDSEELISIIVDIRNIFRKRKDYEMSDEIRNKLLNAGIQLKDEKDGSVSYMIS
jgi:cysteinyl-tRNA synthetase